MITTSEMPISTPPSNFPPSKPSDAEDVHWALSTAHALWKRGDYSEALVWLRKATTAAGDADDDIRVIELAKSVSELTQWFEGESQQENLSIMELETDSSITLRPPPRHTTSETSLSFPPSSAQVIPKQNDTTEKLSPENESRVDSEHKIASSSTIPPRSTASWQALHLEAFQFETLSDIPNTTRESMLIAAETMTLLPDEEIPAPALIVVAQGELSIHAPWHPISLGSLTKGQVCWLAPTSFCHEPLQVRGGTKGARFFSIPLSSIHALETLTPWFIQELQQISEELYVLAGIIKGAWARDLTSSMLEEIVSHSTTLQLNPELVVVKQNEPVHALILVGGGSLLLHSQGSKENQELKAGDIVFAPQLVQQQLAPQTVYASSEGAFVRVTTRASTELLLQKIPELTSLLLSLKEP